MSVCVRRNTENDANVHILDTFYGGVTRQDTGDVCHSGIRLTDTHNPTGDRYPTTILKFNRATGLHPTQKPVALLEYLLRTYTRPSDAILDNTMGSGSTGVACIYMGRKFIGIELDRNYFRLAKDRIEDAAASAANVVPQGTRVLSA